MSSDDILHYIIVYFVQIELKCRSSVWNWSSPSTEDGNKGLESAQRDSTTPHWKAKILRDL